MDVRDAETHELDQLALIWYDGWNDAHAHLVPAELKRERTLESFRDRLQAALADTRVFGAPGAPVGFSIIKGDELYQLYVSAPSRGSGAAAALIDDAEERLAARGVATAWLACAIGNHRAARLRKARLATGGERRVSGGNVERAHCAAGLALRKGSHGRRLNRPSPSNVYCLDNLLPRLSW
jgi:GNAT superfamily N-acetyltransferase